MHSWLMFELNVLMYLLFPLLIARYYRQNRVGALYVYLGIVLFWGGLAGSIYSFQLEKSVSISGGNILYAAFMMTALLLIITERSRSTFFKIIRLLIAVDSFVFICFNLLRYLLREGVAANPLAIPYTLFEVSYWVLIVGGMLIFFEVLLLYALFIQIGSKISNIARLSFLYVAAYMGVLCLDGLLFPILAFGLSKELIMVILGSLPGKLVLMVSFGLPLLAFLLLNKDDVEDFVDAKLQMKDIVNYRFERLVEELHKYEKREQAQRKRILKLIDISGQDQLTGIGNRRKFETFLDTEWSRAQREKIPITLVIGDVDFFKAYNDFYGHAQGDACLRKVAALWGDTARRPTDLAARIGGEEFALVFTHAFPEAIMSNLRIFQDKLREAQIEHAKSSVSPYVTVSMGVASCIPQRGKPSIELYKLADKRLYEAKNSGRNTIVYK